MRTRIFSTPTSGAPNASWQDGDATAGQTGALLPFGTPTGSPVGGGGTLGGPGSFISAQFSLSGAPSTLYVALATNGSTSGVTLSLESYSNFAWIVLDSANLAATGGAVNLPAAAPLGLLRVRIAVSGNATVQCVAIVSATSVAASGNASPAADLFVADIPALRALATPGLTLGTVRGATKPDSLIGLWRLIASTAADAPPGIVRPADFNAASNPRLWKEQL